jgi:UDP-glucose 4-epimerase
MADAIPTSATCLVTGAAGFIGAHLVRELQRCGVSKIVALDDLSGGFRENVPADVTFVEGSVTDRQFVDAVFRAHRFTYVYHLAAYAAEGLSPFIRSFNYTNNVVGSVNVIDAAVNYQVRCLVFTSSIAVYGSGQVPMRESMTPHPEDPYGIAKYAVELDLAAARSTFGLEHVVFRPHNVYGEFQNIGDRYRNVIGIFMNQILQGAPMTIFGDGTQQRAFTYVGDIVGAMAQAAWTPAAYGRVFNVGADVACSVNELAANVANAMHAPGHPVTHAPARHEVHAAFSDHSAAASVFGGNAHTPLDEGLSRMAQWARRVGARATRPFTAIEIERGLPAAWRADV